MGHDHKHHDHNHKHANHDHSHHGHHHHKTNDPNLLLTVLLLTAGFMVVEFLYGYWANSLALTADATHMLADVGALALAYFAIRLSQRPATTTNTFGYYRHEILAAFINGILLAALSIFIVWEAIERLVSPPPVSSQEVLIVGILGLIVNIASASILMKGDRGNLNMRAALLHVAGDALASVGTVIAAILIQWKGWNIADPAASILISIIIVASAYRLIDDTVHIILQGAPKELDTSEVRRALESIDGVAGIHNLHIWSLSSTMTILTVHLVEKSGTKSDLLALAKDLLKTRFSIEHTTIQLEPEAFSKTESRLN